MREFDHNQHSIYLMYYHLIMVVKYRRKVIDNDISKLWKESFWSQSYCLMTAGGAPIEVIRKYIESQGMKR